METVKEEKVTPRSNKLWSSMRDKFLRSPATSQSQLVDSREFQPLTSTEKHLSSTHFRHKGFDNPPFGKCRVIA